MKKTEAKELCLRCAVLLEENGYELETVSEGMIVCAECGRKCWGRAFRVYRTAEEAEK